MAIAEVSRTSDAQLDLIELRHKHRASALTQLMTAAHTRGVVREPEALLAVLQRRERLGSTAIGKRVALPHARSLAVIRPWVVLGRSRRGLEWDAEDGEPVELVLLVLSPAELGAEQHLERLTSLAHLVRLQRVRQKLNEGELAVVTQLVLEAR